MTASITPPAPWRRSPRASAPARRTPSPWTESLEIQPHFQSYFFVLRASALATSAVRGFWSAIASRGDKTAIIRDYEVGQRALLEGAGLTVDILFKDTGEHRNQIQLGWRELLAAGFPFVKVELLRDNPYGADLAGWRDVSLRRRL